MAPGLVGCQALTCVEAAGHWLVVPCHEVIDCRSHGFPELMLTHWWVELGVRRLKSCCMPTCMCSPVLGLVLVNWLAEQGFGVWLQDPEYTELVTDSWLGRGGVS